MGLEHQVNNEIDLTELSAIPDIDQDKVKRYGRQILGLVDNAKRRYLEMTQEAETSGVVPDPNHHNVINLSSSDEYSDDDLFMDEASAFILDNPVSTAPSNAVENITSRYFPPAASPDYESGDDGTVPSNSKGRKRQPASGKRPSRRKYGSAGSWKGKVARPKAKSGDRPTSQSSVPRKNSKAKPPTKSTIGMMPI